MRCPVQPKEESLADAAYAQLRESILKGRIAPNTLWSDRELAAQMALSRTPIREAVQKLAAEGLVEVIPRRGTRVLPLRAEDVREIHQIAKALELEAAMLLAAMPARILTPMTKAVLDMSAALDREDRDAWAEADERFHFGIVDGCGNRRLAEMYHRLRGLTDRARYFALHLRPLPVQSAEEHGEMLKAIGAGNLRRLADLYQSHWTRTTDELLALVEKHSATMPIRTS